MKDFFISYAAQDEEWASWVAWVLEEAGYSVVLQAWDFRPGSNFILDMERALSGAHRIIAILSPAYVQSNYARAEWAAGVATDPEGLERKVVPVRVAPCTPTGLLRAITFIDLVDQHEDEARKKLLEGLSLRRMKPEKAPRYPGSTRSRIAPNHPAFPASSVPKTPTSAHYIPRLPVQVTELDVRRFAQASFDQIRRYFEQGLAALKSSDSRFDTEFQLLHSMKFIAEVYVEGKQCSIAKIWLGTPLGSGLAIGYFEGHGLQAEQDQSFHELLRPEANEDGLHLSALMSSAGLASPSNGSLRPERMTAEQAAEYLWQRFIQKIAPARLAKSSSGMVADAPLPVDFPLPPSKKTKAATPQRWSEYTREQIPPLFGLEFSDALWNTGFVPMPKHLFLLVTLDKKQMAENFRYADRFLSPELFQWQSQNRTTQEGKHGQLLSNHAREGLQVQLFVRAGKRRGSGTAPFVYCGPVSFESWEGEQPITVEWKLSAPVPEDLWGPFNVPAGRALPPEQPQPQRGAKGSTSAQTTPAAPKVKPVSPKRKPRTDEQVDVLVVTAIKPEYDAVLEVETGACPDSQWEVRSGPTGLDVASRDFQGPGNTRLRIAVTRALEMGGVASSNAVSPLVHDYKPRCIAMAGVCAGRKGVVELGDVIIADRLWNYEAGKVVLENDASGHQVERVLGDILTYNLRPRWKQRAESFQPPATSPWLAERPIPYEAQMGWVLAQLMEDRDPRQHPHVRRRCPNWDKVLEGLWRKKWLEAGKLEITEAGRRHMEPLLLMHADGLPEPKPFQVHVAPIATGTKVVRNPGIFEKLSSSMRNVMGLEMEAAAIGAVAHLHQIPMLVMKGVMDFADASKDDHFQHFAARASAECLIAFLRENLSEGKSTAQPEETASPRRGERPSRTQVFISYCHEDERWLKRLETHLKPLARNQLIDLWSDKRIAPGANRLEELQRALAQARIAVLLVSPDYLASDFIAQQVLAPLLAEAEKEQASIFWLPIKSSVYQYTDLAKYQPLVDPARPLSMRHHAHVDGALVEVAQQIVQRLKD